MIFKKIRKGHVDWRNFLCGTPANDYIFQKDTYEYRIDRAVEYIRNADCILIGAGAGASTAAGISMGGKRFTDNFAEFIEKYGSRYDGGTACKSQKDVPSGQHQTSCRGLLCMGKRDPD